ncbi:MAG: class I SAM-dependent methyltransferase [Cyanobacteria bacterium SBLK]|nr:class I SAM-dependent methyltransferase [Cyanobacteria bacterium SBLK]
MYSLEPTKNTRPASFDRQAIAYDRRTGLSEEICRQIAETILDRAGAKTNELVVEVGAGTGQIGQWFGRSHLGVRYLGFDLSEAMLSQFRQRSPQGGENITLLQADGNQPWPIAKGTATVIFGSRSLHLLDRDRVVEECLRIARRDGAILFIGSIERQKESVKTLMKQKMRQLLEQKGFQGREKNRDRLIELFRQRGCEIDSPTAIAEWSVSHTPRQSLESWQNKDGLAGIDPPIAIKQEVLNELQTRAESIFGDIDTPIESQETYRVQTIKINT